MALLQITEPGLEKENENADEIIIGIDLGTTNSLVGVVINDEVEILADDNSQNIIPSIVSYDNSGKLIGVGSNLVGDVVISSIKRLMGKSFEDVRDIEFPFKVIDDKGLRIVIGDRKIRPEEVSAEILKYLRNIAEKKLNVEIKKAVITVPAYFDEAAKNATLLAANLANLEVVRLVNEPTAAALAYGLDNASEGLYCVYDLGGGTFDVSILKMQKGVFRVLGVAGDNQLGGDDFDDLIVEKFPALSRAEAKKIKEELSLHERVDGVANSIQPNSGSSLRGAQRRGNPGDEVGAAMTIEDFENLISTKVNKTITLTENLIEDLELDSVDIKGVILVGGSTRIPLIQKKLAAIFGDQKILTNLDCDRIVVIGAARIAYNLSGKKRNNENNLLLDVVPLSLGVVMMGDIVDKVIMRNSTIPIAMTKEFTTYMDNQTGIKLHIVQGEREIASDCRSLAEFEIKNIPAMKAGLARVAVTFRVDADGLLTVLAQEKITQAKQEIIVKPTYGLDENEVKKMLIDSMQNAKVDIEKRLLAKTVVDAKKDIMILEKDLVEFEGKIDGKEIRKNINNLQRLIADKVDRELIIKAAEELEKSAEEIVLLKVNAALREKITGKNIDEV
jgi:molecular chaperone HscA